MENLRRRSTRTTALTAALLVAHGAVALVLGAEGYVDLVVQVAQTSEPLGWNLLESARAEP